MPCRKIVWSPVRRSQRKFARAVSRIDGLAVDPAAVETNIVMVDISGTGLDSRKFLNLLLEHGVRGHPYTEWIARFTFHPHISDADLEHTLVAIRSVAAQDPRPAAVLFTGLKN